MGHSANTLLGANLLGDRVCFNVYWQRREGAVAAEGVRGAEDGVVQGGKEEEDTGGGGGGGGGGEVDTALRPLEQLFISRGGVPHLGKQHSAGAFARAMRAHPGAARFCRLVRRAYDGWMDK